MTPSNKHLRSSKASDQSSVDTARMSRADTSRPAGAHIDIQIQERVAGGAQHARARSLEATGTHRRSKAQAAIAQAIVNSERVQQDGVSSKSASEDGDARLDTTVLRFHVVQVCSLVLALVVEL